MKNKRTWPSMMPPDLRARIDVLLGTRNMPLAADVWTELREWLEMHEVEPPGRLPEDRGPEGPPRFY